MLRMNTGALFIILILSSRVFGAEVYFTPSKTCEDKIVQHMQQAKKSVLVAVYSINNKTIMNALVAAQTRGLDVKILTDSLQAAGPSSGVLYLTKAKLNVRLHSVHKIMHNKFAIFDKTSGVSGSFNWTESASNKNSENCIFFNESNLLEAFANQFDSLWQLNTQVKSDVKLARLKEKASSRKPSGK